MGKWDFDGDEVCFFLFAGIIAIIGTFRWYWPLLRVSRFGRPGLQRLLLTLAPPTALCPLAFVLTHWADPKYVVHQLDFQLLFLTGGIAWLWIAAWLSPPLGLSPRDDAIEHHNFPAAVAISGGMFGLAIVYAGSNIGAGPTIWTTIVPATIATCAWLVLWWLVELFSYPSEAIAIDRDLATALRQAAFFISTGLIFGRATAGDWTSWDNTFSQLLHDGSPTLIIVAATICLQITMRPTPQNPKPAPLMRGLVPALVLIAISLADVVALGFPQLNPTPK